MATKTKQKFIRMLTTLFVLLGLIAPLSVAAAPAYFANDQTPPSTNISPAGLPNAKANQDNIKKILSIFFGIIGAFALLNITLSGFKYITSAGNPQKASEARNGVAYALIGLIIAISAEAMVALLIKGANG